MLSLTNNSGVLVQSGLHVIWTKLCYYDGSASFKTEGVLIKVQVSKYSTVALGCIFQPSCK